MIKLTYRNLRDQAFNEALFRLSNFRGLKVQTAYQIAKIKDRVGREMPVMQSVFEKLIDKYAKKDEQGKIAPSKDPSGKEIPGTFQVEENLEGWNKEIEEFMALGFEIERHKVHVSELEVTDLSANELTALEPLITDIESVK